MTPPLFLPLAPADREHLASVVVPREWPDAARAHGVDARIMSSLTVGVEAGRLVVSAPGGVQACGLAEPISRAITHLAEALEGLGYAVAWDGGPQVTTCHGPPGHHVDPSVAGARGWVAPRVVGWAAVGCEACDGRGGLWGPEGVSWTCGWCRHGLRRIVDLDPNDSRVQARDDALFAAREDRRGPGLAPDAKRERGRRQAEAQAASWRRAGR